MNPKIQMLSPPLEQHKCPVTTCNKTYKSYPALYTHVKNKHPNTHVTSVKTQSKQNKNNYGAFKLKTLCKDKFSPRQITQMELQKLIFLTIHQIFQSLQNKHGQVLPSQNPFCKQKLKISQLDIISMQKLQINSHELQENKKNVFKNYYGKLAEINFGRQILSYFTDNEIRQNVYLQLVILEDKRQRLNKIKLIQQKVKFNIYEILQKNWIEWQKIDKIEIQQPQSSQSQSKEEKR